MMSPLHVAKSRLPAAAAAVLRPSRGTMAPPPSAVRGVGRSSCGARPSPPLRRRFSSSAGGTTTSAPRGDRIVEESRVRANGVDFSVRISLPSPFDLERTSTSSVEALSSAVLCLPGALGSALTDFAPQLTSPGPLLGEGRALVGLDPRGIGGSRPPERDFPSDFYHRDAEDALAVMRALGFDDPFDVLGWSDGANVALILAASHPDAVRRLCVWGGNSYVEKSDVDAYDAVRDVRQTWSKRMREERSEIFGGVDRLQEVNDRATDAWPASLEEGFGDVCLSALHRVTCETLVIHGSKDVICAEKHAHYIADNVRNSKLVVFEKGKHNLHLQHADEFNVAVGEFLVGGLDAVSDVSIQSHSTRARVKSSPPASEPDVGGIAYGFMASKALFVALRAGVYDSIAAATESTSTNSCSYEDIEKLSTVKGERLRTLLTANVALGLIRSSPSSLTDVYSLPEATRNQLCRDGQHFWGDYLASQVEGQFYERMGDLDATMMLAEGSKEASDEGYEAWFDRDPAAAEQYTRAQHNGSLATAFGLLKKLGESGSGELGPQTQRMLDVGGGSGAFCIAAARKLPSLEEAVVLDLPNVAKVARRIIAEEESPGVADKIRCVGLSANRPNEWFSDPGPSNNSGALPDRGGIHKGEFDVVLMSYVSGSVPAKALDGLYQNAHDALRPGGLAIVHDFVADSDGQGPLNTALWALAHISVNPEGLGLRTGVVVELLEKAGFVAPKVQNMIGGMTRLITVRKPH